MVLERAWLTSSSVVRFWISPLCPSRLGPTYTFVVTSGTLNKVVGPAVLLGPKRTGPLPPGLRSKRADKAKQADVPEVTIAASTELPGRENGSAAGRERYSSLAFLEGNQPFTECILPNCVPRTVGPPHFHCLGVGAGTDGDPLQELEQQCP